MLDLFNQVGTVEPGKLAVMVVMDGNPLSDIDLFKNPERIVHVMKEGAVVRSSIPVT